MSDDKVKKDEWSFKVDAGLADEKAPSKIEEREAKRKEAQKKNLKLDFDNVPKSRSRAEYADGQERDYYLQKTEETPIHKFMHFFQKYLWLFALIVLGLAWFLFTTFIQ